MKLKSIIAGIALTLGSLFVAIQPAQAETCSTGTYTVSGINAFGDLPCQDPGTEINVTVRGLHDYGVSGGPTAYCSFIYVRKNLGTAQSPNWSASTNTVCEPKPIPTPAPVAVITPAPEPISTEIPMPTQYCQGMVCSTTAPTPENNPTGAFAIVDENNKVINVIVGDLSYYGNNNKTVLDNEGCLIECKIIFQAPSDPGSFSASGYNSNGSTIVKYNPEKNNFEVKDNGVLIKTIIAPLMSQTDSGTAVTTLSVVFGSTTDSNTVSASISGKEIVNNSENLVTEQNLFFEKSETEQTVRVAASRLSILSARIERLLNLLNGWLL